MGNYGIKISEVGQDVLDTGLAARFFLLKMDSSFLRVFASGTVSLSSTWNTIAHSLGYIPQFLVFTKNTDQSNYVFLGTGHFTYAVARADSSNLYIKQQGTNSIAYYYIFYEQV